MTAVARAVDRRGVRAVRRPAVVADQVVVVRTVVRRATTAPPTQQ